MNIRDEIKRCLAALPQLAAESESNQIKADIGMLLGVVLQLTTELTHRNAALAKRCQSRKAKPPKASSAKGPQQPKRQPSSTDTPSAQKDAEDRSKELSSIQQGIRQADPRPCRRPRATAPPRPDTRQHVGCAGRGPLDRRNYRHEAGDRGPWLRCEPHQGRITRTGHDPGDPRTAQPQAPDPV